MKNCIIGLKTLKKGFIFRIFLTSFILAAVITVFCACSDNGGSSSVYTREDTEDGVTYKYTLTVDESNNTFSIIRQSDPEITYSGTFVSKNGYLVLQSKKNGTEYVKILGNTFSFFTPDNAETDECEHDYVEAKEVKGTCSSKGYILYICSICGEEKKVSTNYGEHSYTDIKYTKGNCMTKGYTVKKCTYCGDEITVYDKDYGDHVMSEEVRVDSGCLNYVTLKSRCTVCNKYFEEIPTSEYGSHNYGENGVCTYCNYDKTGFCHTHTDGDKDGYCDDCAASSDVCSAYDSDGFFISEDKETLYSGAYPTIEADFSVEEILNGGKFDSSTGYYRFNNASYAVLQKNGVKKAFLVTPIKWSRFTFNGEDFYICDFIIDRNVYLDSTDIVKLSYVSDNKVIYEYYNGNYYTEGGDNNIKANDWEKSALFEFANNSFLSTAFTEKQKLILSGNISIPDISYIDSNGDNKTDSAVFNPQRTAYSDFISSSVSDKSKIFTLSPSEEADNKVICSSGNIVSDGDIYFEYGFVPVIKISAD